MATYVPAACQDTRQMFPCCRFLPTAVLEVHAPIPSTSCQRKCVYADMDVGTGLDGVQAHAFPLCTGGQDFWQLIWFNAINSHKSVAQTMTVRTKQL